MKKLFLLLTGVVLASSGAFGQCGDGVRRIKTYTMAGGNRLWSNANNWSPAGVPDCEDSVVIGRSRVEINQNVSVSELNVIKTAFGTGTISYNSSTPRTITCKRLTMTDGVIDVTTTSIPASLVCQSITSNNNSYLRVKNLTVTNTVVFNNGILSLTIGKSDVKHMYMAKASTLVAPPPGANSVLNIRGHFVLDGSFKHNNGTVRLIDTGRNILSTAGSTGFIREFWNLEINKKLDGAGDITQPGRILTPLTTTERIVALNRLTLSEACLERWETTEYIAIRDSLVVESSMSNNEKDYGFGFNGQIGQQGGMYLLFNGTKNANWVARGSMRGMYNIKLNLSAKTYSVNVTGPVQTVGSNTNYVEITQGILSFDGTKTIRLNTAPQPAGLRIAANGKLMAPDNDTVYFDGSWNVANSESINAQNSIWVFYGRGGRTNLNNNKDTVFLNHLIIRNSNTNPTAGLGFLWTSISDVVSIKGDLIIDDTSDVYIGNVRIDLKGNLVFKQTQTNTLNYAFEQLTFCGGSNQQVTLSTAAIAAAGRSIYINKTGGSVTLNSPIVARRLQLGSGLINSTASNMLTISRPDMVLGGSSISYINGPVRVLNGSSSSLWNTGSNVGGVIPVGGGGLYRPIAFTNAGNDEFEVLYTAANAKSGDALSSPLDAVSTTDLWRVDHISGTSNYRALVYVTGMPSGWSNSELRLAAEVNGSAPWVSLGSTILNPGVYHPDKYLQSSFVPISNTYMLFTHGRDLPAPAMLTQEGISGKEVATVKATATEVVPSTIVEPVKFNVYPNPVQENLLFQILNADKGVITLSDMSGKMLGTYNAAEVKSIDMSRFTAGMYLVSFTDGLNRITHRVVKN